MNLDLSTVLTLLVPVATALAVVVWWVMRKTDDKLDTERSERIADREMFFKAYREERDAREEFFRSIERARQEDRHETRDELNKWVGEFNVHQQRVIREHPTYDRMAEIIKPLTDALEDVKDSVERVFEKLDGKADKTRSAGH